VILQAPGSLVKFFARFVSKDTGLVPDHVRRTLLSMVTGIVLATDRRRSLTSVGSTVQRGSRHKSTVSRTLTDRRFKSREMLWEAVKVAMEMSAPAPGERVEWLLAIDGTAIQRGAFTQIKGAILTERTRRAAKRKKNAPRRRRDAKASSKSKKGRKTKYHTFLLGILTTHQGVRIPLPRYTCDPKDFKRQGRPKKIRDTQLDLAKLMFKRVLEILPEGVDLQVVADSYFESAKLFGMARRCGFTMYAPADSNRCFADDNSPSKSNGCRIRDHGLQLPMDTFSRLDLERGSEETASFRRYSARQPGPKDRRTYWTRHESRTVAGLGTVGVVYSWKTPVYEPRRNDRKKGFKVLLCSDPTRTGHTVADVYETRWTAIEIVIREMKQRLGLADYTGQSLQALERYLDTVLLSFLYLEMERHSLVTDPHTAPELALAAAAETARTQGMQDIVRLEVSREMRQTIRQSYASERARRKLSGFWNAVPPWMDATPYAASS